jgi:hypothetical protein
MNFVNRTNDIFKQTNDDIAKLLQIAGDMSKTLKNNTVLQKEALTQMEKVLADAETIGGQLIQEVKAIRSELATYLQKPSEELRIKVMQDAMHIKNKMREL